MALFKILKGQEKNLPANKTEGWAYVTTDEGNMYVDVSASKRVRIGAHADKADVATKAEGDTESIRAKYLAKLKQVTSNGTTFTFRGETGDGSDAADLITIPLAGDKAGLISNAAQTIKGDKTFTGTGLFSKSSGFEYSGIESAGSDMARPVWFSYGDANHFGKPVINASKFTYNPGTDTMVVGNIKLNGLDIAHNYLTSVEKSGTISIKTKTGDGTEKTFTLEFLPLAGGTMTGPIQYKTTNYTSTPLGVYDEGNNYGHTIVLGAGGTTFVGAGESAAALRTALNTANENLYLSADSNIYFFTKCDTIANRVAMIFDTARNLYPNANNTGSLGTSSNQWSTAYIKNITGKITNATSDDKGQNIADTYIKAIEYVTHATQPKLKYTKGSGGTTELNMPIASATLAGLVTTGAQTIAGTKTFNGGIITRPNSYKYDNGFGINLQNSDIIGANSIYFNDVCDSSNEGIQYIDKSGTYRTLWATGDGILYWSGAHAAGNAASTNYVVVHSGNFNTYDDYITAFAWTGGTTSGPTATITRKNGTTISVAAIPSASSSASGIVTTGAQTIAGEKTFTNNLRFSNITTGVKGIIGTIADNDYWRVVGGANASNQGYLEIATADDANEPIYVRQYSGVFTTLKRTLTLLDANGNTRIPGSLYDKNSQELRANLFLASLFQKTSNGTTFTFGGKNTAGTELSAITIPNASTTLAGLVTAGAKDVVQAFSGDKTFNSCVRIKPTSDNGRQGLRIGYSGGWSMITLGAESDVGYFANSWHIADNNGTFYITHNGSSSSSTGRLTSDVNGNWEINNRLGVNGQNAGYRFYVNGDSLFNGTIYCADTNYYLNTSGDARLRNIYGNIGSNYITITVEGDANTYYPVILGSASDWYPGSIISITRGYSEKAPDTWNTNTHRGGLTLTILWNSSRYWDGNGSGSDEKNCIEILQFKETYSNMVGGIGNSTSGMVVWLRGGSAVYHIFSPRGIHQSASIKMSSWTDSASQTFAPKTTIDSNSILSRRHIVYNTHTNTVGSATKPVYVVGGTPIACTYELKSTIEGGSANRLPYYNATNKIGPTSHYANMTQIGINETNASTIGSHSLYVNGTSYFNGNVTYAGHILPSANNTYDLGSTATRWRYGYLGGLFITTDTGFTSSAANQGKAGSYLGAGFIEMAASTPFIDFHNANSTADFSARIISDGANRLHIQQGGTPVALAYNSRTINPLLYNQGTLYASSQIESAEYFLNNRATAGGGFYVYGNNVQYGRLFMNTVGTTSKVGITQLELGNNKASGVANNSRSRIYMYGQTAGTKLLLDARDRLFMYLYCVDGNNYYTNATGSTSTDYWQIYPEGQHLRFRTHTTGSYDATAGTGAAGSWRYIQMFENGGLALNSTSQSVTPFGGSATTFILRAEGSGYFNGDVWGTASFIANAGSSTTGRGFIARNQNVQYARMYVGTVGTVGTGSANGTVGVGWLMLGNGTAVSTAANAGANNARGAIRLYGTNANYTNIYSQSNGNRDVYFPNYAGTMYLVHAANNNAVGGATTPVYIAANGRVTACTEYKAALDGRYVKKSGDTMTGALSINATTNDGSLKITSHGNTLSVGSMNTGYCHFQNSANIPFYFNKTIYEDGHFLPYLSNTYDLGNTSHYWRNIYASTLCGTSKDVNVASFRTTDEAANYILIKINSAQTHWMTAFTVRVYQGYNVYDVTFSGYQYGTNYWYSPRATLGSDSTVANLTVYFGYTSVNEMWVALPGSSYTGAKVINVVNGYQPLDITTAFSITRVSSLPATLQSTQTIYRPWIRGEAVTSAVWNDYAECRKSDSQEPGYVMFEKGDDSLSKTIERLQHFAGIVSDTWGFSQGETTDAKTNIAVAGRVLAYPYRDRNEYKPGDCVCAAPGGKVDIMTREEIVQYPDRIVGTVSCVPEYEEWGGGEGADRNPVKVNGRIWIKVK